MRRGIRSSSTECSSFDCWMFKKSVQLTLMILQLDGREELIYSNSGELLAQQMQLEEAFSE